MIIIDILNPDNNEEEEKKKKEIEIRLSKEEALRKLPRTSLQIISIDGTIISE